ncbi:MAG: ribosome biogenesis GTP-binding protein YihA/YsxC [Acutalibacteraceae bacterium]|nr:ribosome biogenesis GTP-binding protein YihA/YsxC [Acutalibacteraceae bacterium]
MNFSNAEFTYAAGKSSQLKKSDLPEIVFSGRSNVGKSSLINKIVNRKALARVSGQPGKTATINFFKVGNLFNLVDLPGYGYAKVSHAEKVRWADLVEGYFAQQRQFALVIQIVDMRHKPTKDDLAMVDFLVQTNMPFIVVLTKKDKLNKTQQKQQLELINSILSEYGDIKTFPFSATKGDGAEEIKEFIANCVQEYTNSINVADEAEELEED